MLLGILLTLQAGASARTFGGLTLPPRVYATEGWESNVYFDNLTPGKYVDWAWEVVTGNASSRDMGHFTPGVVQQLDERLRITPQPGPPIKPTPVSIGVLDPDTAELVASAETTLIGTNKSAGAGKTATLLVIGDSLTASGMQTQVLLDIARNDSMALRLVGTRGQSLTNRHEGRGGWTVQDYAEASNGGRPSGYFAVSGVKMPPGGDEATSAPEVPYGVKGVDGSLWMVWNVDIAQDGSGTLGAVCYATACSVPPSGGVLEKQSGVGDEAIAFANFSAGSVNPFWHGGKLDVAAYLKVNAFPTPDVATIMLGFNDLSGAATDPKAEADIAAMVPRLTKIVDALLAGGVRTVGIALCSPPAYDQDGFGANYGTALHRLRMKRAMLKWWAAQMTLAASYAPSTSALAPKVVVVPVGLNLDTQHNMRRVEVPVNARNPMTVMRTVNGVHPADTGQAQLADGFWAWLKHEASLGRVGRAL